MHILAQHLWKNAGMLFFPMFHRTHLIVFSDRESDGVIEIHLQGTSPWTLSYNVSIHPDYSLNGSSYKILDNITESIALIPAAHPGFQLDI
jgi:hypothetical protein